jgi:hypothetical protein
MNKETSKNQQMAQPANPTHEVAEGDLTQGLTFPKSKGTKPTKLTKKTLSRLLKAISNGAPISSACVLAGIANSTLNEWRQEHPEINERIELARERMREKLLARIELAADDDWRAAAELLKLSFASDYRRVVQSGEQKHLHVHGPTVVLSPETAGEDTRAETAHHSNKCGCSTHLGGSKRNHRSRRSAILQSETAITPGGSAARAACRAAA